MKVETMTLLGDGTSVPLEFYDRIKGLIEEVIVCLVPDCSYTVRMMCGEDYWAKLKKGEVLLAGRCVADMVKKGLLPLEPAGCEHQFPKRYKLKSI